MKRESPTFCVMPHMGLAVQNEGDICACNMNPLSFKVDGQVARINNITIDQGWNSLSRKKLATILDIGVRHESCKACWDAEDAGQKSPRQDLNEIYGHLDPLRDQPRIVILKPGNTCNASCRTCRPETSSSWYSDAYKLHKIKNPDVSFKEYIQEFEDVKNSFAKNSPNMWPVLNKWYEHLEFLDLYGGEPWLIDGVWNSLKTAVDEGHAHKIGLRIHTNASVWNDEYVDILSKFKKVTLGISLDSHIAAESEYIRNGINYEKAVENTYKFLDWASKHDNVETYISVTVSTLNIWHLLETVETFKKMFGFAIGFKNYVYTPDHYDIRHLPKDVKQQVINKLLKDKDKDSFMPVINFMNQIIPGCVMYWPKFCLETEKLDKIRNQDFKTVFPEWYKVLEPYWDYRTSHAEWYGSCSIE